LPSVGSLVAGRTCERARISESGDLGARRPAWDGAAAEIFLRSLRFFVELRFICSGRSLSRSKAPMPATVEKLSQKTRQAILVRQASGYVELAELGCLAERPISEATGRLLWRAIGLLDELPEENRWHGDPLLLRAEALRSLGRFTEALPHFEVVVDEAAGSTAGWLGLGWCLKRLGRLDDAITALTRGLSGCPDEPILAYNLSCYHSLAGNVPEAVNYLTRAIASDDRFRSLTTAERDFDPIRDDPRFVALIEEQI